MSTKRTFANMLNEKPSAWLSKTDGVRTRPKRPKEAAKFSPWAKPIKEKEEK